MSEYNICGVLVMARPEMGAIVEDTLNKLEGVEVHARSESGRLVVTVEGALGRPVADTITNLSATKGVVATSLVYHEIETEESQQELAQ